MFENFDEMRVDAGEATLFARRAGRGAPLILLHGFPQTGAAWHRVAPVLAERFDVIVPDLRGYGRSDAPRDDAAHRRYAKRTMGRDIAGLMDALGIEAAHLLGHDRGARVACRMALDLPQRVRRLGIVEILPTAEYWRAMDAAFAMAAYHWVFLAQPYPMPERLIAGDPRGYAKHTMASWTRDKDLSPFDPAALEEHLAQWDDPARVHAMCADYRAGASADRADDEADLEAGRRLAAPVRGIFADTGFPVRAGDPAAAWSRWAHEVETSVARSGHFLPEENPAALLDAMRPHFLAG